MKRETAPPRKHLLYWAEFGLPSCLNLTPSPSSFLPPLPSRIPRRRPTGLLLPLLGPPLSHAPKTHLFRLQAPDRRRTHQRSAWQDRRGPAPRRPLQLSPDPMAPRPGHRGPVALQPKKIGRPGKPSDTKQVERLQRKNEQLERELALVRYHDRPRRRGLSLAALPALHQLALLLLGRTGQVELTFLLAETP